MPKRDQSPHNKGGFVFSFGRSVLGLQAYVGSKEEKAMLYNLKGGVDF